MHHDELSIKVYRFVMAESIVGDKNSLTSVLWMGKTLQEALPDDLCAAMLLGNTSLWQLKKSFFIPATVAVVMTRR